MSTQEKLMQSSAVLPSASPLPELTGVIHVTPPTPDPRSNLPQDTFGATLMGLLDAKDLASTGSLLIVELFGNGDDSRLSSLKRALATLAPGAKVRGTVLDWFYDNTDEGHAMRARYNALEKATDREDKDERAGIKKRQNAVNVMLQDAVETMTGIDTLRAAGWDVAIETVNGTSARQCVARKSGDTMPTILSLNAIRHAKEVENIASLKTKDMFAAARKASTAKQGTPNVEPSTPNGETIEPTKIGLVANRLDTTLQAYVEPTTGQFQGLSENNRKEIYLLWAFLSATLTDVEKAQAAEVYKMDAAKLKDTTATMNAAAAASARLRQIEAEKKAGANVPAPAPVADAPVSSMVEGEHPNVTIAKAIKKARKNKKVA